MDRDEHDTVEVYVAYLNDVNQLRTSRQTDNTTRLGVVTLLLGAQAFLINTVLTDVSQTKPTFPVNSLGSWVPIVGISLVGFVGCYFSVNWRRLLEDTQHTLTVKFSNLEDMEREHPALQLAGARLFIKERADRHRAPTNAPPPQEAKRPQEKPVAVAIDVGTSSPASATPVPSAKLSRSKRGVSKRVSDLARFFFWLFLINSIGAPLLKILAIFGPSWLAALVLNIH